jgi:hypothetical protein
VAAGRAGAWHYRDVRGGCPAPDIDLEGTHRSPMVARSTLRCDAGVGPRDGARDTVGNRLKFGALVIHVPRVLRHRRAANGIQRRCCPPSRLHVDAPLTTVPPLSPPWPPPPNAEGL